LNPNNLFFESIKTLLTKIPQSWVDLTTHRLDIYNEPQAKSEFLVELKKLLEKGDYSTSELEQLPTAYDYIRLGHQLSSLLEWVIAEINAVPVEQVISFSSKTMPLLALLRKKALSSEHTHIYYNTESSPFIDELRLKQIYGYSYVLIKVKDASEIPRHEGGTVAFVSQESFKTVFNSNCDVTVNLHAQFGAVMVIHNPINNTVSDVQHVRRRETIAMTPPNALNLLNQMVNGEIHQPIDTQQQDAQVLHQCIAENTGSSLTPLIASSGLSIQYAILMGFVENALTQYPNKPIKILLPPNCYGGTNDQSRRITT
jgi:cystathionine beta-lyase/cystathionine gamma-synthase